VLPTEGWHTLLRQETIALRHFNPAYVRFGSFASDAVEATWACLSAVARKRTNGPCCLDPL